MYAVFQADQEEPSYQLARSFVHPDDVRFWETAIREAVDGRRSFSLDYRAVRSDGEIIWVHNDTVADLDEKGNLVGFRGAVQDITERKRAEERMRLYLMMFEQCTEAIAVSNAEGRLVYVNPAHERLFGRTLPEARKLNYRAYYPPESVEILDREVAPALSRGEHWEGELDALDATGRRFPLWERADSMLGPDGRMLFAFGFMHDITKQKCAEDALEQSRQALRALASELALSEDRERQRMASYLHDQIGQSLAALRLKVATWRSATSPVLREKMLSETEQLLEQVIDETRSLTFEISPPLLSALGPGPALEALGENLFAEQDVLFRFQEDASEGRLEDALARVLYRIGRELLLNVLRHADARTVSVRLSAGDNCVCLVVKDDGVGMTPGCYETALAGRGETYGLFSLAERLHYMGGSVAIESEPGGGACVRVTLPLSSQASSPVGGLP